MEERNPREEAGAISAM
uniref:Uncharacterized protein n=1 Tax=Arundo donax TaxID=35708 RepID=A0A0A9H5T5_ARUDO